MRPALDEGGRYAVGRLSPPRETRLQQPRGFGCLASRFALRLAAELFSVLLHNRNGRFEANADTAPVINVAALCCHPTDDILGSNYQRTAQSTISPPKWRPLKSDTARPPSLEPPSQGAEGFPTEPACSLDCKIE